MKTAGGRVLMVAATPFFADRGCHIRILGEIRALKAAGWDATLCTYRIGGDVPGVDLRRSPGLPGYRRLAPGASWAKLLLDLFLLLTTIRELLRSRPRVIHAHQYESLVVAFLARLLTFSRARLVFDCQGSLAEEMRRYHFQDSVLRRPLYAAFLAVERLLLRLPDRILCSSERGAGFLSTTFGIPRKAIVVAPDGWGQARATLSDSERREVRRRLGIPDGNRVGVYAGSVSRAKGVDALIGALPALVAADPRFTLLVVGYGDLSPVPESRSAGSVVFAGRVAYADLPGILAAADFAVDPKPPTSEASGKIMDYLAAGLPVVCLQSPSGKLRDIVTVIDSLDRLPGVMATLQKRELPAAVLEEYSWAATARIITGIYAAARSARTLP